MFFDELGPPWPKHPCTDGTSNHFYAESDTDFPATVSEEPENRANNIPQWQREGWEAYYCTGVDQQYSLYSVHTKRITGRLFSTGSPLTLYTYTTAPSHNLQKERMGLMMVKCVCKRAKRYLCEVAEVSEGCILSFRFTAYSEAEMRILGWSVDYLSENPYYIMRAELEKLAEWFIHTINLPLSPFVLLTGEQVRNPINYYEGLHILLAKPPTSRIVPSGMRLISKLRSLREYIRANCDDEN